MKNHPKSIKRSIITSAILLCIAAALSFAARNVSGFAEWYSINVYSLIVRSVGYVTGLMPFSLAEAVVICLPFIIIIDFVRRRRALRVALSHLLLLAAVLLFLYSANCGVNYYRSSFVDQQSVIDARFTEDQLAEFCEYIAAQIKDSSQADEYPAGRELLNTARVSMYELSEEYPVLQGFYPAPKQIGILSRVFSAMGVSGIYSPFTVEANINGEMPAIEKPFTACHELSHLRGFMNEGEANYIGWLACIGSEDRSFNRSGWLIAWNHAGGVLRRIDPERYAALYKQLPDEAIRELEDNHIFWASHESKASDVQDRLNDSYLKANGQQEGVQSYGRLTTLMLMWYYD